jgi:hypothetical protein
MAINKCDDPMQFRLLAKLAGGLALGICVAPLCRRFLARQGSLDRRFPKLRGAVTPLRVVVRRALGAMPTDVLPLIEHYVEEARRLKSPSEKFGLRVKRLPSGGGGAG